MSTKPATSNELTAAATHDIANALVAVLGWAQLAREGAVDPVEAVAAIEAAARIAHRTALDALGDSVDDGPTDLATLAHDLARLLGPQARERRVRVEVDAPAPSWVSCGRTPALRIAWNLVLNAIQVLPEGGTVRLVVEPGALLIDDDGPGMDRTTQEKVLAGGHSARPGGRGLGLSSVRRLVRQSGGSLTLDSVPGRGTRFRIELPTGLARPRSPSHVRPRLDVARILVVDDDDGVRDLLLTTLRLRGLHVVGARAAHEVDSLTEPFDVALVDLTLGETSGLDVVESLRARGLARLMVAMSGLPQLPEVAPDRAPDRWLRKPFDATQLFEVLGLEHEDLAFGTSEG